MHSAFLAFVLASVAILPCGAQGRLSEKGITAQTVGQTTITVEYYRPVARGREKLIGGVVPWGSFWTPGANWATTVDVDHDVLVEGQRLPKGKYSLWAVPRPDSWTIVFRRHARIFHISRPDSTDEQLRITVRPDSGPVTEVLTFDFPQVAPGGTTLRFRWGTTLIPIHLSMIAPPLGMTSREARAPLLGRYDLEVFPLPGITPRRILVDILEERDTLRWRDADGPPTARRDFVLSPSVAGEFTRARRAPDGQYWTDSGVSLLFTMAGGRASGFEVQLEDGSTVSRAKRVP
jgi:hypothetical protein